MSAIYQRARPISWEQVVGQEQVKDVLRGALEQGRVGHAYLFSGPRGVGKTTTARLIAMTANCQSSGPKPCGECESCLSVRAGNHPDVLEIDAASNNSVDDVRDLREKVGLAAMRGGKKIYILDEAHMMSRAAFNALLKTLEEPPEHVIFILATTEPEKILPTIMSRCQHYRFRRLTDDEIAGKLQLLAQQEGVQADNEALHLIGRLADGAMRDGESLLERMLASGEAITRHSVEHALGLPPSEWMQGIAGALVSQDAATLLAGAAQMYRDGYAARTVVEGLVTALGEALHAELGLGGTKLQGATIPALLKLQAALDEQSSRFARAADQQSLELALTHALMALQPVASLPERSGSALPAPALSPSPEVMHRLSQLEREVQTLRAGGLTQGVAHSMAPNTGTPNSMAPNHTQQTTPSAEEKLRATPRPSQGTGNWAEVVQRTSIQMRAFLKPARMHAQPGYVSLSYDDKGKFHAKQVYNKFDDIAALVVQVFGAVTFELISPEHNRKQALGDSQAPVIPEATTTLISQTATATPEKAPFELPVFDAPEIKRVPNSTSAIGAALPSLDELPDFEPVRRSPDATRPTGLSTGKHIEHSPDDIAPAPLPHKQESQQHAADAPPQPVDSGPAPFATSATVAPASGGSGSDVSEASSASSSQSVYIPVEPLAQEPDWDDLPPFETGPPFELAGAAVVAPAPALQAPPQKPPKQAPAPKAPPQAATATSVPVGSSSPGAAIRNHPNFQEVTRLFSGRIKEVGEVKKTTATPEEAAIPEEETAEESDT